MIKYYVKISVIKQRGELDSFGCIIPEIIVDEEIIDSEPIIARERAFSLCQSFQDVFRDANDIGVEKFEGIEDIFSILSNSKFESSAVNIELWFDSEDLDLTLPCRNRIIYGNTTFSLDKIENLAKEMKYYKSRGLAYTGSKILNVNQIGSFEIIDSTPEIDPKLYQFFK